MPTILMCWGENEPTPTNLLCKVLTSFSLLMLCVFLLRMIGRLCGVEKVSIRCRLLCGWLHISVFSPMLVGQNEEREISPTYISCEMDDENILYVFHVMSLQAFSLP